MNSDGVTYRSVPGRAQDGLGGAADTVGHLLVATCWRRAASAERGAWDP